MFLVFFGFVFLFVSYLMFVEIISSRREGKEIEYVENWILTLKVCDITIIELM